LIQKTDSIEIAAGWIISYFALDDSNAPIGPFSIKPVIKWVRLQKNLIFICHKQVNNDTKSGTAETVCPMADRPSSND